MPAGQVAMVGRTAGFGKDIVPRTAHRFGKPADQRRQVILPRPVDFGIEPPGMPDHDTLMHQSIPVGIRSRQAGAQA